MHGVLTEDLESTHQIPEVLIPMFQTTGLVPLFSVGDQGANGDVSPIYCKECHLSWGK